MTPRVAKIEVEIVQLRSEMNNGFSALSYALNRMHSEIMARFEGIDRRFDAVNRRFDAQDLEIAAIKQRLP